jgi:hypothetical protein
MTIQGLAFSRATKDAERLARKRQYELQSLRGSALPENGTPQEQSDWHNANASEAVKIAHTVHELGHLIALRESGIRHEGMILGTYPSPTGWGVVHGMTKLPSTMFRSDGSLDPEYLAAFVDASVSGAASEREILGQESEGGESDLKNVVIELKKAGYASEQAQRYVNDSFERQRELFRRPSVRQEIQNAVRPLVERHHLGKLVPPHVVDRYLKGEQ